jgi:L-arabinokinase
MDAKVRRRRGPLVGFQLATASSASKALIAVYSTGHGLGHATRLALVVDELLARDPHVRVAVRGRVPEFLFPDRPRVARSDLEIDFGLRQADPLVIDHERTIADLAAYAASREERTRAEVDWLSSVEASLVLGDIAPIAFAAAATRGIPSVALGNFSWDWIYRGLSRQHRAYDRFAALAAEAYRTASVCLRLPLHGDMTAFPTIVDVPFVARRADATRDEAKRRLGVATGRPTLLLSFGGYSFPRAACERLAGSGEFEILVTDSSMPAAPHVHPVSGVRDFSMLVRAADVVLGKVGWGVFASAIVNGTRVLYVARDDFPESEVLAAGVERLGTARRVSAEKMSAGDVADEIRQLLLRPVAETPPPADGAAVVAERLLEALDATRA